MKYGEWLKYGGKCRAHQIYRRIRWELGFPIMVYPSPSGVLDNFGMIIYSDGTSNHIPRPKEKPVMVRPYKKRWQWWVRD